MTTTASSSLHSPIPLVSTRISLRWPPALPTELTDTLVLTGRTGFYLDLRVFIAGPRVGEIDWATAGIKAWLEGSTAEKPKASFTSILDSRVTPSSLTSSSSSPPPPSEDIGDFFPLPNGDVLETGSMSNPDNQDLVQPYEEVWRRLPVDSDAKVVMLERVSEGEGVKAFLGRIGKWEIGLAQLKDGEFFARRVEGVGESGKEVYCIGGEKAKEILPTLPKGGVEVGIGGKISLGGFETVKDSSDVTIENKQEYPRSKDASALGFTCWYHIFLPGWHNLVTYAACHSLNRRAIRMIVAATFGLLVILCFGGFVPHDSIPKIIEHTLIGNCTSAQNLVEPYHRERAIIFSHNGALRELDIFSLLLSRYYHPTTKIALLRHYTGPTGTTSMTDQIDQEERVTLESDPIGIKIEKVIEEAKVDVVWVNLKNQTREHNQLYRTYAHSAKNALDYERFCFMRFLSTHWYMEENGLEDAFVMDLDIIPLTDVFEYFPAQPYTPVSHGTMFTHWTLPTLSKFTRSILSFYSSSPPELVKSLLKYSDNKITLIKFANEAGAHLPPQDRGVDLSPYWPTDKVRGHFSDMFYLRMWRLLHPHVLPTFEGAMPRPDRSLMSVHGIARDVLGKSSDLCLELGTFETFYKWNKNGTENERPGMVNYWGEQVPGIHMQGPNCKLLACAVFCPQLEVEHQRLFECCTAGSR